MTHNFNLNQTLKNQTLITFLLSCFAFFLPISIALMNIFLYLSVILILVSINYKKDLISSWKNPIAKYGAIMFLIYIIGSIWSVASANEIINELSTYKKFLLIILFIPYLSIKKINWQVTRAFYTSMAMILLLIYAMYFKILEPIDYYFHNIHIRLTIDGGFKTHIITNFLFSITGFLSLQRFFALNNKLFLVFSALIFNYVFFISTGLTGKFLGVSLIILILIQRKSINTAIIILLPLFLLNIMTNTSTTLHSLNKVQGGILNYKENQIINTGVGKRLSMIENALIVISKRPILGYGTGSLREAHKMNYSDFPPTLNTRYKTTNPHTEYLTVAIQLGIFGVIFYLLFIYKIYKQVTKINDTHYKALAQGIPLIIFISSIGNSVILEAGEGHFIMLLIALVFSQDKYIKILDEH